MDTGNGWHLGMETGYLWSLYAAQVSMLYSTPTVISILKHSNVKSVQLAMWEWKNSLCGNQSLSPGTDHNPLIPSSGLIHFDVGVVHKQFSLSSFDTPRDCLACSMLNDDNQLILQIVAKWFLLYPSINHGQLTHKIRFQSFEDSQYLGFKRL
ncbi:hypothetical protein QVD17_20589 [Tagetes erecta]|uniref:Uncharacterized protein n=1 Tax=Tagetes erecta TaxID=13708 RepID=A0AAD8KPY6_TARER|nr:hypothetical protein QVD17_20589 [Tagetes erecta]